MHSGNQEINRLRFAYLFVTVLNQINYKFIILCLYLLQFFLVKQLLGGGALSHPLIRQ